MKKFLCFILCGVLLLGLCSCKQSIAPLAWTEETQNQIKRDYAAFLNEHFVNKDTSVDEVTIDNYFGIYQNDAVALFVSGNELFPCVIVEKDIADIHFSFGSTQILYIYHEGTFVPLEEAYKEGIVTKEDVREIHDRF